MSNTIALALTALLAPIAAHYLWPTAFEETVGCVTLAVSLYWCRTHWKSYVAFTGLLIAVLAVTLPLFALVTGLWLFVTGGLTLLCIGLCKLKHIRVSGLQDLPTGTTKRQTQRLEFDDELAKPLAVFCMNGIPMGEYDGSQVMVEVGTLDPFDLSNS